MNGKVPHWITALSDEDCQFLKRFVLASGSLKALAREYGISYPTVRARLDRLIEKVKVADDPSLKDPFHKQVQMLMADGVIGAGVARGLLEIHYQTLEERLGKPKEEGQ